MKIRPEVYLLEIIRRASPTKTDMGNYLKIYSYLRDDWQDILCALEKIGIVCVDKDVLSLSDIGAEMLSKIKTDFLLNGYFDETKDISDVMRRTHPVLVDEIGILNVPPPYFIAFKVREYYDSIRKDIHFQTYAFNPSEYSRKDGGIKARSEAAANNLPINRAKNIRNGETAKTPAYGLIKDANLIFISYEDGKNSVKKSIANCYKLFPEGRNLLSALESVSKVGSTNNIKFEEVLSKLKWITGTNGRRTVTCSGMRALRDLRTLDSIDVSAAHIDATAQDY